MTSATIDLASAARGLLTRPDAATSGLWPRATALLARQAIENTLRDLWLLRAPGVEKCPTRAQLLCLPYFVGNAALAERVSYAWAALSRACHQHPYELPPTAPELATWLELVEDFTRAVEQLTGSSKRTDR